MRARLTTTSRKLRKPEPQRRIHQMPLREQPVQTEPEAPEPDLLSDERRARASGGPLDRAQYSCSCGYVFHADVSTSVTCPHCGAAQAW